jgi:hypothetical protein
MQDHMKVPSIEILVEVKVEVEVEVDVVELH